MTRQNPDRVKAVGLLNADAKRRHLEDINQRSGALAQIIMAGVQGCCSGFSAEQVVHVVFRCGATIARQAGWDETQLRLFVVKVWDSVPAQPQVNQKGDGN